MIDIVLARKLPTVTDHCSLLNTAPDSLHSPRGISFSGQAGFPVGIKVRLTNYRSPKASEGQALCSCTLSVIEQDVSFKLQASSCKLQASSL